MHMQAGVNPPGFAGVSEALGGKDLIPACVYSDDHAWTIQRFPSSHSCISNWPAQPETGYYCRVTWLVVVNFRMLIKSTLAVSSLFACRF